MGKLVESLAAEESLVPEMQIVYTETAVDNLPVGMDEQNYLVFELPVVHL